MEELLKLGLKGLRELYHKKEISPREVVDFQIAQIEKLQPHINAVCEKNFEAARKMAQQQSENFSEFSNKPLFGSPFSVKEMLAFQDFHLTAGSVARKDYVSTKTATVVQRLVNAGGIPLCTTNVPEIGFWWETNNPLYGRTRNPYDLSRISGGSSGGEAALIAGRGVFFGVGSDIGGSIRNPSAFCGISGHKPSPKLIPLTGHFQTEHNEIKYKAGNKYPYTTLGPLARHTADLPLLFNLMSGEDGWDPEVKGKLEINEVLRDPTELKVYYIDHPVFHLASATSEEVAQAVRSSADLFSQLGCEVQALNPRLFKNGLPYWITALQSVSELPKYEEVLTNQKGLSHKIALAKEFLEFFKGHGSYTLPSLLFVLMEKFKLTEKDLKKYHEELLHFKKEFHDFLGTDGVLIMPVMPTSAPRHNHPLLSPCDFIYSGVFNALEVPATSVPVGLSKEGLPLAVQIIASPHQDENALSAAIAIEKVFGALPAPSI